MMIKNLLLTVLLLSCLTKAQVDLQSQYCNLQANTTAEIVYDVSENTAGRTSTEFLLKTQAFTLNGNTISLAYFEDQGSLRIEESDSTLTTIVHDDNTENLLLYIDSLNQYIVAKEIKDQTTGEFDYVLFTATLGTAGSMTKFTISSLIDASNNDISGLNLLKVLDIVDGYFIVLLSGDQQTSLYKINTASEENLSLQGDLSTTSKINIIGGNAQSIFSADENVVYISSSSTDSNYQAYTYTELGVQNVLSTSLSIQRLGDLTLAYNTNSGVTNFYPLLMNSLSSPVISTLSGSFTSYTDNYQNFLAVTTSDLIWYRITAGSVSVKKLSDSKLSSTEQNSLLNVLNLASSISFDGQSALVITQEASQSTGSVYSVTFDTTASKEFLIVNTVMNAINLEDSTAANLIEPGSITEYETSISCNCISPVIDRFECYANALKCITVAGVSRQTCNKA